MKEPWQLTKKEFCLGRVIPPTLSPHWVIPMAEGPAMRFKTIDAAFNWLHKEHKLWVRYAISEGKPVPAKVLADYPDLQRRYGGLGMVEQRKHRKPSKITMSSGACASHPCTHCVFGMVDI